MERIDLASSCDSDGSFDDNKTLESYVIDPSTWVFETEVPRSIKCEQECKPTPQVPPKHGCVGIDASLLEKICQSSMENQLVRRLLQENTVFVNSRPVTNVACLLGYSQRHCSQMLGVPHSTFSKKWKKATSGRKWPSKKVQMLQREIYSLEEKFSFGCPSEQERIAFQVEASKLVTELREELRPVYLPL
eukprot:TRINITY_DN2666_c0_g1_i1.p1 TRINITY_DN2666_c0_g1~~TRINITY_DN2666_c0_g1_i1.p1  ORF type:complete len:190 (+),score=22.17 TRINITY_DN2666_c0_g1_i1:70-639(+)